MEIRLGTKSLVKLSKLTIFLLISFAVGYFLLSPFFTYGVVTTSLSVNTGLNNLAKNGTSKIFNFTITLSAASSNSSQSINITIPINTTGNVGNFTVDNVSYVPSINISGWTLDYPTNFTGNSGTQTIRFTNNSESNLLFNGSSARISLNLTPTIYGLVDDNISTTFAVNLTFNNTTTEVSTVNIFVDDRTPRISDTTPGTTTFIKGTTTQLFNATVADTNLNTTNASLHWNIGGGGWQNVSGIACLGTSPNFGCNTTVNLGSTGNGDVIQFFFEATDNATNYNNNGTFASPLTATVDQVAPQYGNITTGVTNGSQYSPGKIYAFNVTWADASAGVSTVLFEFNNTTAGVSATLNNTTAVSLGSNNYSVVFSDLPGGIYTYKWYANDLVLPSSDANWNSTTTSTFNISVNQSNPVNFYLNGTANSNRSYTYPAAVNATVASVYSNAGNVNLFRGGAQVASGASPQSENVLLGNATFAYQANASANANYTANATGVTFYALVNLGSPTLSLLLNGTAANLTVSSNAQVNATVTIDNSQGAIQIFRNGTLINTSTGTNTSIENMTAYTGLPSTIYNMTGFYAATQNYTSASETWYIIIESGVPTFVSQASNITNASTIGKFGNGTILISAQWNDAFTLNNYWFSNNTSSSFVNDSAVAFAAGNWTNITFNPNIVNITAGNAVVQMRIYGNDTSGNQNVTQTFQFTVDGVAPVLSSPSPSNNSYIGGTASQNFSISITDATLNSSNTTVHFKPSVSANWNNTTATCTGASPSYFCSVLLDLSGQPDNRTIQYLFDTSDLSQLSGTSATFANPYTSVIDRQKPFFFSVAQNVTTIGLNDGVNLSAQWTDNQNLSYAVLETNETGSAANKTGFYGSPFLFSSGGTGPTTVSFNWTNSSIASGTTISWRIFVNDTLGNANVTGYTNFTMSGNAPQITANTTNTTNATTIAKGTQINVSATWNDALRLDKWWVQIGTTGNNSIANTTAVPFTSTNVSNYTIDTSQFTASSVINATIFANNTAGVQNNTRNSNFFVQWTIDGTQPQYFSNTTAAVGTYTSSDSNFTVTWTDNIALSQGFVEENFTGTLRNSSMTASVLNSTSSAFSYNLTLPAGTFQYRYLANDSSGNFNATPTFTVSVLQANVSLNLALNTTEGNNTYIYPAATNATTWRNSTINNEGNLSLYRNGSIVASSTSASTVSENVVLGNNSYNYSVVFTATNYSTNSITTNRYALVNKGSSLITLLINGTAANYTTQQGSAINFTASVNTSYGVTIFLNTSITGWGGAQNNTGSRIENTTSMGSITGTNFNATAWFPEDANFSSSIQSYFFNVTADTTGPSVTVLVIGNATPAASNQTFVFNISVSDAGVGLATSGNQCNITIASVATSNVSYSGSAPSGFCNGTITIPAAGQLGADGNKTLNVTIADTAGNVGKNDTLVLQLDNTLPTITITVPASVNGTYNKSTAAGFWINGTIRDNLNSSNTIGVGNVTIGGNNASSFAVYSWNGLNNTAYAVRNSSALSTDGNYSLTLTFNDSANNTGQVAVSFFKDDTAPSAVIGISNSSSGKYQSNSTQRIYVQITDNLQTNGTIQLFYYLSSNSTWTQTTANPVDSLGTKTTYVTGTIDTTDMVDNQYAKFYITGIDNATNSITTSVGGSASSPVANITVDFYCGSNGVALAFCSRTSLYDFNWRSLDLPPANVVQNWTSLSSNFTVPSVLGSISGQYNYVYYYNGTNWIAFDPSVPLAQSDLKIANNTNNNPYWVNMTAAGIVRIS